jgi:hypothetical protein
MKSAHEKTTKRDSPIDAVYRNRIFTPDWSNMWTPAEAENRLIDFKFKGVGWYIRKVPNLKSMLTILVVPEVKYDQYFVFHFYNNRNPMDAFNWAVNAPVQEDDR